MNRKEGQQIVIVNSKPIVHSSFYNSLFFEVLIAIYYGVMVFFAMNIHNRRIIIYCLLFILNEFTKIAHFLLSSIDPLGIGSAKMVLKLLGWAAKIDMLYQLCTLLAIEHPLPVTLMILHCVAANSRLNRPQATVHHREKRSFYKVMDFINPILLYSFVKQFDSGQSDLSIVFLVYLCVNLVCASELRLVLAHQEGDILGWTAHEQEGGKMGFVWNRDHALKLILIITCGCLFLQNISLFFNSIKREVSLNIIHTLIIGLVAYTAGFNKNYTR